ncbi:MAG TPA: hypothetical protein VIA18_16070 [Polyangia bacterium]|jgi:hypothetical protein|nr:hypothetical protein [Polyangia bacterium]
MTAAHRKQLLMIGVGLALAIGVLLVGWTMVARAGLLPLTTACRLAGVSSQLLLATAIFLPLVLPQPPEARRRGFVVLWFILSVTFNFLWELPLVVFKAQLSTMAITLENLPRNIGWWSYTLSDSHYFHASPFMITVELWWLVANAFAVAGLLVWRRGKAALGQLLCGVGGALQAYNATLYIGGNGIMDHFSNVAAGSTLALVLYWGFNLLWSCAAIIASILAFRGALRDR